MTKEQEKVREFHQVFEILINTEPTIADLDTRNLRRKLIAEELYELRDAFLANDIVKTADALGDLLYVVYGAGVALGIDLEPIFNEIHRSNMTKVGGHKRADGKWIKPDSYEVANLEPIILEQG